MTIQTKAKFYYDFVIDSESTFLNFDEGAIELTAQLNPGSYTMTDLATEIARALNNAGGLEYTVTVDRTTRRYTISSTATFNLLSNSGSNVGLSGWTVFGFDISTDKTGASSYEGENSAGQEFIPQFYLQDYVSFDDWQGFASSKVNESASGVTEVYSLGSRLFSEFNITNQNNGLAGTVGQALEPDLNGVDNLRSFMVFAITKGPMEMMPDRDDVNTFDKIILESTRQSKDGTEFRLKELVNKRLAGWFETGKIKFRKQ